MVIIVHDSLVKKLLRAFESCSSKFDFNHPRYVNEMYSISVRVDLLKRLYLSLVKYATKYQIFLWGLFSLKQSILDIIISRAIIFNNMTKCFEWTIWKHLMLQIVTIIPIIYAFINRTSLNNCLLSFCVNNQSFSCISNPYLKIPT